MYIIFLIRLPSETNNGKWTRKLSALLVCNIYHVAQINIILKASFLCKLTIYLGHFLYIEASKFYKIKLSHRK